LVGVSNRESSAIDKGVITLRTDDKRQAADDYVTRAHFCQIFQEDTQSLYLLAFLLTANHKNAEQCFFTSMEEALNERTVFKERARSWSRRLVIRNAIRLIAASSAQSQEPPECWAEADDESAAWMTLSAVTQLAPFGRIVFVMSGLERYSEWECASLLDSRARDVQAARIRALQQLPALYPAMAG
jgi:hypothetical protein